MKHLLYANILGLSYDFAAGSDIMSCIKIDTNLVVYIFSNVIKVHTGKYY